MNYYFFSTSFNNEVVGTVSQVEKAIYHSDIWSEPKFIDQITFQQVDFEPIVANAVLKPKAKATDLINAPIIGFSSKLLLSTKLLQVLSKFRRQGFQAFRSPVVQRGKFLENYWVFRANSTIFTNDLLPTIVNSALAQISSEVQNGWLPVAGVGNRFLQLTNRVLGRNGSLFTTESLNYGQVSFDIPRDNNLIVKCPIRAISTLNLNTSGCP